MTGTRRLAAAALVALVVSGPPRARAWLPEGHLATGAIAYDVLEQHDPEAISVMLQLVRSHPAWRWLEQDLGDLGGRARARRILELMAIWPDIARGGPLDHDDWHYSQAFVGTFHHLVPFAFGGADAAFRRNLAIARDERAEPAARAVALCWVMHIVGDMHQPLHAALRISWRFPISDAGGNWAWVRRSAGAAPERLHWFWDSAGRPNGLARASPDEFVAWLEWKHPYDPAATTPQPGEAFDRWVAHTRVLAYEIVYRRTTLQPGTSPESAPVLPPDYVAQARVVGAGQIAAAGNRIGALLIGLR